MELALSTGVRWGVYRKMWDEAEGIIALASTGNSDDEQPRGRQRDSEPTSFPDDISDEEEEVNFVMQEESRSSTVTITARRASILLPDDDVFGGANLDAMYPESSLSHGKSRERLNRGHSKSFSTSSTDSRKVGGVGRSDPVAVAKSMMERMQRGSSDSLYGGGPSVSPSPNGTLQFDTKMLGPLLEKVKNLLGSLEESLKGEGEFGGISLGIECGGA